MARKTYNDKLQIGGINLHKVTIEPVSIENAMDILHFEIENKQFFETFVSARQERYYDLDFFMGLIESIVEDQKQGSCYMYIVRNAEAEMVGRVNLFSVERGFHQKAEIGYRIGERHQGKGYGTKAARLAVEMGFGPLKLHRIEAGTSPTNIGSQIILIKNGFQMIGKAHHVIQVNGRWEDSLMFEKINSD